MTDLSQIDDDTLDDEDDDYFYDEDEWEDDDFPASIKNEYPEWFLLKITNFNGAKLGDVDVWMQENCTRGQHKRVGWYSGCSYSVGVVIENPRDAMMFRLRWN